MQSEKIEGMGKLGPFKGSISVKALIRNIINARGDVVQRGL